MPSRTAVIGFVAGWISVAALIGGFAWIVAAQDDGVSMAFRKSFCSFRASFGSRRHGG